MLKWLSQYTNGRRVCRSRKNRYDLSEAARSNGHFSILPYESMSSTDFNTTASRALSTSCVEQSGNFRSCLESPAAEKRSSPAIMTDHRSCGKSRSAAKKRVKKASNRSSSRPRQLSPSVESRLCSMPSQEDVGDDEFFILCKPNDSQEELSSSKCTNNHTTVDNSNKGDSRRKSATMIFNDFGNRTGGLDHFETPLRRKSFSAGHSIGPNNRLMPSGLLFHSPSDRVDEQNCKLLDNIASEDESSAYLNSSKSSPQSLKSQPVGEANTSRPSRNSVICETSGVTRIKVSLPRRSHSEGAMIDEGFEDMQLHSATLPRKSSTVDVDKSGWVLTLPIASKSEYGIKSNNSCSFQSDAKHRGNGANFTRNISMSRSACRMNSSYQTRMNRDATRSHSTSWFARDQPCLPCAPLRSGHSMPRVGGSVITNGSLARMRRGVSATGRQPSCGTAAVDLSIKTAALATATSGRASAMQLPPHVSQAGGIVAADLARQKPRRSLSLLVRPHSDGEDCERDIKRLTFVPTDRSSCERLFSEPDVDSGDGTPAKSYNGQRAHAQQLSGVSTLPRVVAKYRHIRPSSVENTSTSAATQTSPQLSPEPSPLHRVAFTDMRLGEESSSVSNLGSPLLRQFHSLAYSSLPSIQSGTHTALSSDFHEVSTRAPPIDRGNNRDESFCARQSEHTSFHNKSMSGELNYRDESVAGIDSNSIAADNTQHSRETKASFDAVTNTSSHVCLNVYDQTGCGKLSVNNDRDSGRKDSSDVGADKNYYDSRSAGKNGTRTTHEPTFPSANLSSEHAVSMGVATEAAKFTNHHQQRQPQRETTTSTAVAACCHTDNRSVLSLDNHDASTSGSLAAGDKLSSSTAMAEATVGLSRGKHVFDREQSVRAAAQSGDKSVQASTAVWHVNHASHDYDGISCDVDVASGAEKTCVHTLYVGAIVEAAAAIKTDGVIRVNLDSSPENCSADGERVTEDTRHRRHSETSQRRTHSSPALCSSAIMSFRLSAIHSSPSPSEASAGLTSKTGVMSMETDEEDDRKNGGNVTAILTNRPVFGNHTPRAQVFASDKQLTSEMREHLAWCTDADFDECIQQLTVEALGEVAEMLHSGLLIEQRTYNSLQCQLEAPSGGETERQQLKMALALSQGRLDRLCVRKMSCHSQYTMRGGDKTSCSVSELDMVSSDAPSFRQNLSFFQKVSQQRQQTQKANSCHGNDTPSLLGAGHPKPKMTSAVSSTLIGTESVTSAVKREDGRLSTLKSVRSENDVGARGSAVASTVIQSTSVRSDKSAFSKSHQHKSAGTTAVGDSKHSESVQVQPPRRRPYIRFGSVEEPSSNDDLSWSKQTAGIISDSRQPPGAITRTRSCQEGLDRQELHRQTEWRESSARVSRTVSHNSLAECCDQEDAARGSREDSRQSAPTRSTLKRVPSVDEILESVKSLRSKRAEKAQSSESQINSDADMRTSIKSTKLHDNINGERNSLSSKFNSKLTVNDASSKNHSSSSVKQGKQYQRKDKLSSGTDAHIQQHKMFYENVHMLDSSCYENMTSNPRILPVDSVEVIYDQPMNGSVVQSAVMAPQHIEQSTYMNTPTPSHSAGLYQNVERGHVEVSGNGVLTSSQYDVPRVASHVYDRPQAYGTEDHDECGVLAGTATYDTPRSSASSARDRTASSSKRIMSDRECDRDSLEGTSPPQPSIPSPDYVTELEADGIPNDYVGDDQLDEGLGESSDGRSYYNDDPAGLEVILEEPEEEYISSSDEDHSDHDDDEDGEVVDDSEEACAASSPGSVDSTADEVHSNTSAGSSSGIHSADSTPTMVCAEREGEERVQRDRCLEVYPETMRQRKHNSKSKTTRSVDIKHWKDSSRRSPSLADGNQRDSDGSGNVLPSVKALKSQFEGSSANSTSGRRSARQNGGVKKQKAPAAPVNCRTNMEKNSSSERCSTISSSQSSDQHQESSMSSQHSQGRSHCRRGKHTGNEDKSTTEPSVGNVFEQFSEVDERLMRPAIAVSQWNPMALVERLYNIADPDQKSHVQDQAYINIEGWLEKLPSGRKKATFWNAWKRRYFKAKDGFLYYYQNNSSDKPSMKLQLMGGHVETSDNAIIGIDDGKGNYVVLRATSDDECERWRQALLSHTVDNFAATYIHPVPISTCPRITKQCVVIDLGSSSIRAGILHSEPTLPHVFIPAAMTTPSDGGRPVFGARALLPEVRAAGRLSFPLRPGARVGKYSVDMTSLAGLLRCVLQQLRVQPGSCDLQLSLPRSFNTTTLAAILALLFDEFGARGVNLTHQSILAMWSYGATSGIVVDIGDRTDVVPVIDGYIVEGGVSRVPYGGASIQDNLRHFLQQKRYSLTSEVERLLIRLVLESSCYVAADYQHELRQFQEQPRHFDKPVVVKHLMANCCNWRRIELDCGRFQAPEGLFTPEVWGLDCNGVHKLVHKAIKECSVDVRKQMLRSIYLAGGVTLLPGFAERLEAELQRVSTVSVAPKVHASPHRYHAAYLGACVLAASDGFQQAKVSRDSWLKLGAAALNKWTV